MTENPWIEHDGGPMPVDAEAVAVVRFRNGRVFNSARAKHHCWYHRSSPVDIIAYRLTGPSA